MISIAVEVAGRLNLQAMICRQGEAKVLASLGSPRLETSSQALQ